MLSAPANLPYWHEIDTVLLDLDGTLLDLAFDNYVWLGRIPEIYAEARGLSVPEAQAALAPKFRALQGTLDWYCIEQWSRALDIDIARLHREEAHRISWLPGARGFLERMRELRKRLVLLTNSHPVTLAIKHEQTGVLDYFDAAFSSKQFGAPKEDAHFWSEARAAEPFDPARSVFVDDSAAVLHAARAAGIRWVFAVRRPDTSRRGHAHEEFTAVDAVAELG
jgi:putative hydrolase of the HAD superfamily